MTPPLPRNRFSPEDYIAWEATQETKHEYVDGEVFAMVGASSAHNRLSLNLASLLLAHLRGTACSVFISDMKVGVQADNAFYYPDVVVTCEGPDHMAESDYVKERPRLLIEVLSPSTSGYDRGRKFASYRKLSSLREFVVVDQELVCVECFRRDNNAHWVLYAFGPGDDVEFASVGLKLNIELIYEGVTFQSGGNSRAQSS